MTKRIIRYICVLAMLMALPGEVAASVRIHCEQDTAIVSRLMAEASARGGTLGEKVRLCGQGSCRHPYQSPRDNDSIGTMVVDLHGFDRLGFVNNVLAIAMASRKKRACRQGL